MFIFNEGHKASPYDHFWIGLRKHCSSCPFAWDDWSPFDYEQWGQDEPNNNGDGEDCVEQYVMPEAEIKPNHGWNDEHCMAGYSMVCSVFPNGSPFTWNDPHKWPESGGCRQGWTPFGGLCYVFANSILGQTPGESDQAMDFTTADQTCRKINPQSNLATPTSIFHMSFLAANLVSVGQNTWIGVRSTSTQDKTFHWVNADPARLGYVFWDTISPRGMDGNNKDRLCVAGKLNYNHCT